MFLGFDYYAFFDGGYSKKKGAFAWVIKDSKNELLWEASAPCQSDSSNQSEFIALLELLKAFYELKFKSFD